eukprot:5020880-Alexandrium_andersonii.AAC.1
MALCCMRTPARMRPSREKELGRAVWIDPEYLKCEPPQISLYAKLRRCCSSKLTSPDALVHA